MKVHLVDNTKKLITAIDKPLKDLKLGAVESMDFDEAIDNIHKQIPGVVIINWAAEDSDIENFCKRIRRLKLSQYIYILIIASRDKEKRMNKMLNAGADDFIFKPLSKDEFALRMKIAQKITKLEDGVSISKKKLIRLAKEDPLTNLLNRRAVLDMALKEMGRAAREKKFFSAIIVNASNFKRIVNAYGADIGDEVLVEFSRRMKSKCRPYDMAGRYGISDFLIFLPDTGIDNANKVARRILAAISEKPFQIKGRKMNVSISIGVSQLNPDEVVSNNKVDAHLLNDLLLDSLIKRSEIALGKAEKQGRNSIFIQDIS